MNISYNWLKEYVDFDLTAQEVADALTSEGLEVGWPQKLEHNDLCWITTAEIPQYPFCPADRVILEKLIAEFPTTHQNS